MINIKILPRRCSWCKCWLLASITCPLWKPVFHVQCAIKYVNHKWAVKK